MRRIGDEIHEIIRPLDLSPIPTKHRGVEFRSRLEARWAVFMDALRVRWAYEFEGFRLPSGYYLPDFWLPDQRVWLEIKPYEPSDEEIAHCAELARMTGNRVLLAYGGPSLEGEGESILSFFPNDTMDGGYRFCECPACHAIGIEFEGRGHRVCGDRCFPDMDRGHSADAERFLVAYSAAQSARFWG